MRVWFSKIQAFHFFGLLNFFFQFLWTCLSKYRWKDMTGRMKHFEQQISSSLCSVLYQVVHPKKVPYSYWTKLWPTQIWNVCYSETKNKNKNKNKNKKKKPKTKTKQNKTKKQKNKNKNAYRSGIPICHKLWDTEFFFFSLILCYTLTHTEIARVYWLL